MRRAAIAIALALLLAQGVLADEPANTPDLLQNPWQRDVTLLDGEWHVIVDPNENGFYNHRFEEYEDGYFRNRKPASASDLVEYDFATSPRLQVPGDWNTQDERLFFYEGTVWYQRDFDVSKNDGKRYVLYFGAVNYEAIVYVNGEKVGRHEGGFTPFQFDVSDVLRDGANFVVVKADNRREADNIPAVNTDWWNYGGITRPVALIELGRTYVADYTLALQNEEGSFSADSSRVIEGTVWLDGDLPAGDGGVVIEVPELGVTHSSVPGPDGIARFEFVAKPELWRPADPRLYEVRIRYGDKVIHDQIGFRHIDVDGQDILLNGQPVFLRGISLHEEAPLREGRAWSAADAERLLTWARDLGCNFVRLAHYPHNEQMLRMADKLGLMVWAEIPVYWTVDFTSDAVFDKAEGQLVEMIRRDRNRASVVLWSVANETPSTEARYDFLERLVGRARELDASRLVTAAMDTQVADGSTRIISDPLAAVVDVIGVNSYCGWYGPQAPEECAGLEWRSSYQKPVIISEFGAGALQGRHGAESERWTEEYQASVYRNNLAMIRNMPFVRGVSPWILKDFRSPRRPLPGVQDYWNRKGLLSETGERKAAWYLLRDYYSELSAEDRRGD